ncbi:MAG: glycosyltransferase [Gemmatimonadota bacterium]
MAADVAGTRGREAISVAVASFRRPSLLAECLASLRSQAVKDGVEIVVARAGSAQEVERLERSFPSVRFVRAPEGSPVPVLRGLALSSARAPLIALTEDHCVCAGDWLVHLTAALREGADVVGGAMDNAQRDRLVDWAAFFAEYGFFGARAGRAGSAPDPTGANVAYTAATARAVAEWARAGLWENVAHDRLRARGARFAFRPEARAYQNQNYRLADFCRDRFRHGRDYARRRLVDEGGRQRWRRLALVPGLPVLLWFRVAASADRRHRPFLLAAAPFTLLFLSCWSVGEFSGYLSGGTRG